MEARIKDLSLDYLVGRELPVEIRQELEGALSRFRGDMSGIESEIVPPGHPLPDHPWELASLGTIGHHAWLRVPAVTSEVRRVRNALAHGAPVGWRAYGLVERLERELENARLPTRGNSVS
jgi:hypothetical protein